MKITFSSKQIYERVMKGNSVCCSHLRQNHFTWNNFRWKVFCLQSLPFHQLLFRLTIDGLNRRWWCCRGADILFAFFPCVGHYYTLVKKCVKSLFVEQPVVPIIVEQSDHFVFCSSVLSKYRHPGEISHRIMNRIWSNFYCILLKFPWIGRTGMLSIWVGVASAPPLNVDQYDSTTKQTTLRRSEGTLCEPHERAKLSTRLIRNVLFPFLR